MQQYRSLGEIKAHFRGLQGSLRSGDQVILNASLADPANGQTAGVSAEVTGIHLYLRLELAVSYTTTSNNDERKQLIRLQGKLIQGFHEILAEFDGVVLEAQGEMVHGFIPSENEDTRGAAEAMRRMMVFVGEVIQPRAGSDYRKCTGSFCYGDTIFVSAPGSHQDLSIVSLSNAANAPAKILYLKADQLSEKQVVEVDLDGGLTPLRLLEEQRVLEMKSEVKAMSALLPEIEEGLITTANQASPLVGPPDMGDQSQPQPSANPTIEDPRPAFAVCVRADIEGFTQMVADGFSGSPDQRRELAALFFDVMTCCRDFCHQLELEVVQMPWAGDSFNLLLVSKDIPGYQALREEDIVRITSSFEDHLKAHFPDLIWSFACAGGTVDQRQICNTLISRIQLPSDSDLQSHMITVGLPIQRALEGQIKGGVDGSEGALWREDVQALSGRYQKIVHYRPENPNHFKFIVDQVRQLTQFKPNPLAYSTPAILSGSRTSTPTVRPHCLGEVPHSR